MSNEPIMELHANENDIIDDNEDMVSVHEEVEEETSEVKEQADKVKNFYYNLDLSKQNIFYSDIYMPEKYLKPIPKQFVYKYMKGSLEQMVQVITKDIDDIETPKLLIIQCFGKVLYNRTNQSVIDFLYQMISQVDDLGIHKIAPSTNHFIPAKPGSWEHCAHYNAETRIMCIDRGQPPLTLHKALMYRELVDYGPLLITGSMWQEYELGEGLGHTLSKAGYKKYLHFILKAFENQFKNRHHPSKRYIGTPQPPPLSETIGYSDNPRMMQILEEEGLLNVPNHRRTQQVPPQNRFQAVDPPASTQERHSAPVPVVPQPGRSASSSSLSNATGNHSKKERPKTWCGQNMVISEANSSRKVIIPDANNDSGVFDDSRVFNEDQDKIDKHNRQATDLRKRYVSWEEMETAYENLKHDNREDERYYKDKIDALLLEKEDLKDKVFDLKEENDTLKDADDLHKSQLRSLQRQLDAKTEECELKDERIKLVEQQCRFIKNLHNGMGELFYDKNDKNDKHDKKKKRNN